MMKLEAMPSTKEMTRLVDGLTNNDTKDEDLPHNPNRDALKIYVAGPYSVKDVATHDVPRAVYNNVRKAIRAGHDIISRGHYPYVPHLSHFMHLESDVDLGVWYYEWDNAFLDVCDALLYLAPSNGADNELNRAMANKMTVFYSVNDIPLIRR